MSNPFGAVEIVATTRTERYRIGNADVTTVTKIYKMHTGEFPGALMRALVDPPKEGRTYA